MEEREEKKKKKKKEKESEGEVTAEKRENQISVDFVSPPVTLSVPQALSLLMDLQSPFAHMDVKGSAYLLFGVDLSPGLV